MRLATQWSYCSTANKPAGSSRLFSISHHRAEGRGRITTNTKTNGSISSRAGLVFLINGIWTDLFPGDCVYSPRGSVHAFKNNTDQPIRVFINIAPSGFERFFAEAAEWWANPERDMSRIAAIEEKYRTFSVKQ